MTARKAALFRAAKWLSHKNVRGSGYLLSACLPCWRTERARYALSSGVTLEVPIGTSEHCWDMTDVEAYEHELVSAFCCAIGSMSEVTLFDCGADIGLFSAVVCSRCAWVSRVLAFEPNLAVRDTFERNIACLPGGEPYEAAVGESAGFGRLERPHYAPWSDHASYVVPAETGFPVLPLDSFGIFGGNIAIKIDVEGGELGVIRGAIETIRTAAQCVLTLEVHPQVCARSGVRPGACMTQLESIRPFRFLVTETGHWIKSSDAVIQQGRVLNLLCIAHCGDGAAWR